MDAAAGSRRGIAPQHDDIIDVNDLVDVDDDTPTPLEQAPREQY
jgi:hypothetical protein